MQVDNNGIKVVGSYLSPYVRKVLVCLQLKGLAYEIDPIVPFFGSSEFSEISPLRRAPVLFDGDLVLSDSTVIVEYLNEAYPGTNLLPDSASLRAKARWLEEFADSRLGEVLIWHLYNQVIIKKYVWGQEPDQSVLSKALEHEIPGALDYLETQLPEQGFLFGELGSADISVASFFRNAAFSRYRVDAERWPKVATYLKRVLELECFASLHAFENVCLTTPIQRHREALIQAGAPIWEKTYGTDKPVAGIMSV